MKIEIEGGLFERVGRLRPGFHTQQCEMGLVPADLRRSKKKGE